MIQIQYFKTPVGDLVSGVYRDRLCLLDFRHRRMRESIDNRLKTQLNSPFIEADHPLFSRVQAQLHEYLDGYREVFDLPLLMVGSEFQKRVWEGLMHIPFGRTSSYLQLAKNVGNPKAVRAVAGANGANALAIVVPCHRIIGHRGELVGYGGGLPIKRKLLTLEQRQHQLDLLA